ncbi:hypothetical protein J0910_03865 [Nocardiopsis sp. CNT-189]|uniref:hypothetical protein n=1 Tax=Nocardiopsis oceanisediminis TaxID=2816862 RepID=UPI003B2DD99A
MNGIKRILLGSAIVIPAFFGFAGAASADTDVSVTDADFAAAYSEKFGVAYAPAGFALGHSVDKAVAASEQTVDVSTR